MGLKEGTMEKKGLCMTCISDKTCSFPRKFPVIICEEFGIITRETNSRKYKVKRKR